ncbi:MAG: hypothetical protein DRJ50_07330 [Actinobacteria bacterium]|nr:MAG: hypothetical protein DRJ50_07330 [Actinomycetota bacterium]
MHAPGLAWVGVPCRRFTSAADDGTYGRQSRVLSMRRSLVCDLDAVVPGGIGRIAFYSTMHSTPGEIYVRDFFGGTPIRLTHNTSVDTNPVWSPDGSRITLLSTRDSIDVPMSWMPTAWARRVSPTARRPTPCSVPLWRTTRIVPHRSARSVRLGVDSRGRRLPST